MVCKEPSALNTAHMLSGGGSHNSEERFDCTDRQAVPRHVLLLSQIMVFSKQPTPSHQQVRGTENPKVEVLSTEKKACLLNHTEHDDPQQENPGGSLTNTNVKHKSWAQGGFLIINEESNCSQEILVSETQAWITKELILKTTRFSTVTY